jgi:hypothetical protein
MISPVSPTSARFQPGTSDERGQYEPIIFARFSISPFSSRGRETQEMADYLSEKEGLAPSGD